MQSVTIGPNQAGQRLDKLLRKLLPQAQSSFLYKMLRKKNITLNGKRAEGKEMLAQGDEVRFFLADETYLKFGGYIPAGPASSASNGPEYPKVTQPYLQAFSRLTGISVLYEDEHVLVLDKPAGVLTQKASAQDLSLNEWMIGYLLDSHFLREEELHAFRPSVCNRLDRNTSGLVLCGKSLAGSQELSLLIRERGVRKFYRTVVHGILRESAEIQGWLVKDENKNRVTISPDKGEDSSYIRTVYQPVCSAHGLTYLEVELITGKTHQIRAHLASEGYPLIGDHKYGDLARNQPFKQRYRLDSQLLHAYRLEFPPLSGALRGLNNKQLTAPLPEKFVRILKDNALGGWRINCNSKDRDLLQ